jgi:hypothetical protein
VQCSAKRGEIAKRETLEEAKKPPRQIGLPTANRELAWPVQCSGVQCSALQCSAVNRPGPTAFHTTQGGQFGKPPGDQFNNGSKEYKLKLENQPTNDST